MPSVQTGSKLGPYEILSAIGAGGMGEVYEARDTRLNRTVAVKVLPSHFSASPEMKARFDREAQTIAGLNHPHICVLYDVGHQDGTDYLVMEYLEGQTLAQRLQRGAMPLDEALKIAAEIADALDKAHRQGVVHRDLKPSNVMLTKNGAKLLDFGLAKLKHEVEPAPTLSALPTNADVTAKGTILGTLQYMSPEQLEGLEADVRSDIFAFGAVLYEMVTGQKAFQGRSQSSVIAAIMHVNPPDVSTLQPMTPPAVNRVVKKCLAKDPAERWQTAKDLLDVLDWSTHSELATVVAGKRSMGRRKIAAWSISLLILSGVAVLLLSRLFPSVSRMEAPVLRFEIETPLAPLQDPISLSPDGKHVVVTDPGQRYRLWLRSLDQLDGQSLPGTEGASSPFWSPDSRYIGFVAGGKLKKMDLFGTPPQTISDAPIGSGGGTWNSDGVILLGSESGPLFSVAASGGPPKPVTELDKTRDEMSHTRPYFLPDGKHFIYLARSTKPENNGIFVDTLEKKSRKFLVNSRFQAVFAPPGYLIYAQENILMAIRFDPARLELIGDPASINAQVLLGAVTSGSAAFSVSGTGMLAYRVGSDVVVRREFGFVDRNGKPQGGPISAEEGNYQNPVLSPDEQSIAVNRGEQGSDIWIFDRIRGGSTKFTFDPGTDDYPLWSPDGKSIVFASNRDGGNGNLYMKPASGVGQEQLLLKSDHAKVPTDWSHDERFVIYEDLDAKTGADLMVLPMFGDKKPMEYLRTPFNERQARFSPDSKWVAYTSEESGRPEVYVQSFPPTGNKWLISTAGGFQPRWRADGKELFYLSPVADDQFMAVDILTRPGESDFRAGVPKKLFIINVFTGGQPGIQRDSYDVTKGGQRFLLNGGIGASAAPPVRPVVTFVLNWTAALTKK
jgi:serine/threonine protein kinase